MSAASGVIAWQKYSFIDFPGTISTVLFFGGCNLRCPYCHNPEIVLNRLPEIPLTEITGYLDKRKGTVEGVVLSGGEPTLHASLPETIALFRDAGFKIKLDTNGLNPDIVIRCSPDYLAVDLKTSFDKYSLLGCGLPDTRERIEKTLEIARSMGLDAEVRITVAPKITDDESIRKMAEVLKGIYRVYLQPVQLNVPLLDPSFAETLPLTTETIETFRKVIAEVVDYCEIRTTD